ncbi:MAG: hypothetical protein Q4E10_02765 [Porphyromonas sp.]|nr:hypothetical protein [Porphyromonas sp.]
MNQDNTTAPKQKYTIAVDFDGTIVTHEYPKIGREIPGAVEVLKRLLGDGHRLILWTVREQGLLDEALAWCEARGLVFYAVNSNYPEEQTADRHFSRKLQADIFIDDRSIGGLPDWKVMYKMISDGTPFTTPSNESHVVDDIHLEMMERYRSSYGKEGKQRKKGLFSKLF